MEKNYLYHRDGYRRRQNLLTALLLHHLRESGGRCAPGDETVLFGGARGCAVVAIAAARRLSDRK